MPERFKQQREVILDRFPDNLEADVWVVVYHHIAHVLHKTPGNLRIRCIHLGGDGPGGFTDNREIPYHGIHHEIVCREGFERHACCIDTNLGNGVENVADAQLPLPTWHGWPRGGSLPSILYVRHLA